MPDQFIKKVIVIGGQASGWISASVLANSFPENKQGQSLEIIVVELPDSPDQAAAESSLPELVKFHQQLGIDEQQLMRQTQATFKLANEFVGWQSLEDSFMQGLGTQGSTLGIVAFHHFASKMRASGSAHTFESYSLGAMAARNNKFARPDNNPASLLSTLDYALHVDLGLYTAFMKRYAQSLGVKCICAGISNVKLAEKNGNIQALILSDGQRIEADLFLDCSEQKALIIDQLPGSEFSNWQHWFPCDASLEVSTANTGDPLPYTRYLTQPNGWTQSIPLQGLSNHRYHYQSDLMGAGEAESLFAENFEGLGLSEVRHASIQSGFRPTPWLRNCIAIGHSAGRCEPITATYLHQIYNGILRLVQLFPHASSNELTRLEYNRLSVNEYESLRDYALLPYALSTSSDTDFWQQRRACILPISLVHKIKLFKESGHLVHSDAEIFAPHQWVSAFTGLGCLPETYDPFADLVPLEKLNEQYEQMRQHILQTVVSMPEHYQVLARYCPADTIQVRNPG